jgi:nucleoside-diphosphate-sugar epimerase
VIAHSHSKLGELTTLPPGTEIVVNSAGRLGGQGCQREEFEAANVLLPATLCRECREACIPLIHLSTPGVNGLSADALESDPYNPMGIYEVTKTEAEKHLIANCPGVTILRPDFVFGAGDMHKLPLFKLVSKGWFPLIGTGSAKTRPTDVRDVARAVLQSFPGEVLAEGIYNIGGPEVLSVKEIAERISISMGKTVRFLPMPVLLFKIAVRLGPLCPKALSASRFRLFGSNRYTNIEKAGRKGFSPVYSFAQTASETIEWYKAKGLL